MADKEPTETEIEKAREVLGRAHTAERKREAAAMQDIVALGTAEAFTATLDAITSLDPKWLQHSRIGPQLQAARTGLSGIAQIAHRAADASAQG